MTSPISLREVLDSDLPCFFVNEQDPVANHMAAFTRKDPADRKAFDAHWARIRSVPSIVIRTIVMDGRVAGNLASWVQDGEREITYGISRDLWRRGVATAALRLFLDELKDRPLFARAAKDNLGSLRVLEKCGFRVLREERGFANARGAEIAELVLRLDLRSRRAKARPSVSPGSRCPRTPPTARPRRRRSS